MQMLREWLRAGAFLRHKKIVTALVAVAQIALVLVLLFVPSFRWLALGVMMALLLHDWVNFAGQRRLDRAIWWDYAVMVYDTVLVSWAVFLFSDQVPFVAALYFLVILLGASARKLEGGALAATLAIIAYNLVFFFSTSSVDIVNSIFSTLLFGISGLAAGLLSQQEEAAQEALLTERERARLRAERIAALEVGRVITSTLDLNRVLQVIMQRITKTLDAEAGSILLVEGDDLVFRVALGEMAEAVAPIRLKIGQGIAGWVAQEGRPLLVPQVQEDKRFYPQVDAQSRFHTRSILCVPLKSRNKIIGVIEVINKRSENFVEDDLYWLSMVSSSAAIAIENAQLYEQMQEQVDALADANQELRETQDQLVRSTKLASIGQLAAGVAHEINNPLSVILGFAETIPKLGNFPAIEDPLATIRQEALRCRRIIQQLLDFSSQSLLSLQPVNMNDLLDQTLPLMQYQIAMQDVRVLRDYQRDLPMILADADQLQQVFVNMILNAAQAMPKGGELTLRTGTMEGQLSVKFIDTGTGIAPEDLDRLFEPFFSTKGVGEGTGLGLSVSYGIIEQHGGTITVESQLGQGTTFTVLLPIKDWELEASN